MKQKRSLFLVLALVAVIGAIWSFMILNTARRSANETLDQRVQDVASQLKCPICQGESVADSPSQLAQEMRGVIRQQLQAGRSEQQVVQYFVDRYGQQIVWSPPWQGFTLLAWLVPIILLLGGAVLLLMVLRDWYTAPRVGTNDDDADLAGIDEAQLQRYRAQIEEELAGSDPIFAPRRMEAN